MIMTPKLQALQLLMAYCSEFKELYPPSSISQKPKPSESAAVRSMLQADSQVQIAVIRAALRHITWYYHRNKALPIDELCLKHNLSRTHVSYRLIVEAQALQLVSIYGVQSKPHTSDQSMKPQDFFW